MQDKRRHDFVDRLSRSLSFSLPEICRSSVPVNVRREIRIHPFSECLRADIGLEHAQYRGAFFISDAVEHLFDLGGGAGISMNRAGRGQGINADNLLSLFRRIVLEMPLWMPSLNRFSRHPRGKAFVEPDVVPPRGRN